MPSLTDIELLPNVALQLTFIKSSFFNDKVCSKEIEVTSLTLVLNNKSFLQKIKHSSKKQEKELFFYQQI